MKTRQPIKDIVFFLRNEQVRANLISKIQNLPLDEIKPLQITIGEMRVKRKLDQNAAMWATLTDIAEQCWVEGRLYDAKVWHEYFKGEFLPNGFDPELCLKNYEKYIYDFKGNRILTGSTTDLTTKGFYWYKEQIIAYGANKGVQFRTKDEPF